MTCFPICAQPYTSIFMHKIWRRFIDKLQEVLNYRNDVHPTIKFTIKHSPLIIDFLGTSIHLGEHGKLFSNVYSKPTGTFPLLDFKSNHPVETKLSIIYSQARRFRLLTTYDEDFMKSLSRLKCILLARGYPQSHDQFQVLRSFHIIPKGTPVHTQQQ